MNIYVDFKREVEKLYNTKDSNELWNEMSDFKKQAFNAVSLEENRKRAYLLFFKKQNKIFQDQVGNWLFQQNKIVAKDFLHNSSEILGYLFEQISISLEHGGFQVNQDFKNDYAELFESTKNIVERYKIKRRQQFRKSILKFVGNRFVKLFGLGAILITLLINILESNPDIQEKISEFLKSIGVL